MNKLISDLKLHFQDNNNLSSFTINNFEEIKNTIEYPEPITGRYSKKYLYQDDTFEIVLLVWGKKSSTCNHKHPENGCILKVLKGKLLEKKYREELIYNISILKEDAGGYMHNNLGTHVVSSENESYSLHIYSPPKYYAECDKKYGIVL